MIPVTVTVSDTGGEPYADLPVYAFDGDTYTGHNSTSDENGQVVFTLSEGSYRFRSDLNGTQFWSGESNHCAVPECDSSTVVVTIPVTVTVQATSGDPYADLPVYVFDGDTYTGHNGMSDENGQVVFTLPEGSYHFRADYNGVQFWSDEENHCDLPGCLEAIVEIPGGFGEVEVTIEYTYDALYRLTAADYDDGTTFKYTYDAVGNRLTEETDESTSTYTYDAANRLTDVNGVAYTWDANGNLLADGTGTYTYDAANRLVGLVEGEYTYAYTYNGLGDRLSQVENGETINYTLDLNRGLTQVLSDHTNAYLYGNGRISEEQPNGWQYHMVDALGSVRQLTDADMAISLAQSYTPFGKTLYSAGDGETAFDYTGEMRDASGLTYLRSRYLNNSTGRFISRDTWSGDNQNPITLNRWVYANANPLSFVDPTGMEPIDDTGYDGSLKSMYQGACSFLIGDDRTRCQLIVRGLDPNTGFDANIADELEVFDICSESNAGTFCSPECERARELLELYPFAVSKFTTYDTSRRIGYWYHYLFINEKGIWNDYGDRIPTILEVATLGMGGEYSANVIKNNVSIAIEGISWAFAQKMSRYSFYSMFGGRGSVIRRVAQAFFGTDKIPRVVTPILPNTDQLYFSSLTNDYAWYSGSNYKNAVRSIFTNWTWRQEDDNAPFEWANTKEESTEEFLIFINAGAQLSRGNSSLDYVHDAIWWARRELVGPNKKADYSVLYIETYYQNTYSPFTPVEKGLR